MKKPEEFEVILERLPDWEFLKKLPKELYGFTFREGGRMNRDELVLCFYENEAWHRRLELIYTRETFDYTAVRQVGLHRYRDFRYITRDRDMFAERMFRVLPHLVKEITPDFIPRSHQMLKSKGILEWEYPETLPNRIGRFEKFIAPPYPLEFINNTTIILDYADFSGGNDLVFLYNRARNEFYAETKTGFIPNTVHDFDAVSLKELEGLIGEKLETYLLNLGRV